MLNILNKELNNKNYLIIVPPSLIDLWYDKLNYYSELFNIKKLKLYKTKNNLNSKIKKIQKWNEKKNGILIISYDTIESFKKNINLENYKVLDTFLFNNSNLCYCILDECHCMLKKNYNEILESIEFIKNNFLVLGLTATPFQIGFKSLKLIFNVFEKIDFEDINLLNDNINIKNFLINLQNIKKNLNDLKNISFYYKKIVKTDSIFKIIFLKLIEKNDYLRVDEKNLKLNPCSEEKKNFKYLMHPNLNVIDSFIEKKDIEKSSKLSFLIDLINEFKNKKEKIIICSYYSSLFYFLGKFLVREGFILECEYCVVDGKTRDRETVIDAFNLFNGFKILFLNYKVGSLGFDISDCSVMIFLETPWNSQTIYQMQGRIQRSNQKNNCKFYLFVTTDSIEIRIFYIFILRYFIFQYLFINDRLTINENNLQQIFENKIVFNEKQISKEWMFKDFIFEK
jgi:superfamily II DNA or RNA helicase